MYRKLRVEWTKQLQPDENIEFQGRFDIKLCTYGIVVADLFAIEEKWINKEIIPSALKEVDGIEKPELVSSLSELVSSLDRLQAG